MAFSINILNRSYISKTNSENLEINTKSLVHASTIWSVDNSWYLPQVKYLLAGEGYTLDPKEPEMRVRRTPGYSLFYGFFYWLFGEERAHQILPFVQTLLFALSAVLITLNVFDFFGSRPWALFSGITYAITPFVSSFCFFTLTESLFPFLVVLTLFVFGRYLKTRMRYQLFLTGVALALTFLTRPLTGVLLLGFLAFLFLEEGSGWKSIRIKMTSATVLLFGFVLVLTPWVIRNYIQTNELIVAEKIYHGAPMEYGRAHVELRNLVSSWTNPANFSTEVFSNSLRMNIGKGKAHLNDKAIKEYINKWPEESYQGFERSELDAALNLLNTHFIARHEYQVKNPNILRAEYLDLPSEMIAYTALHHLRERFKSEAPIRYYVLTPLKTSYGFIFNSFLHHFAILNPVGGDLSSIQFLFKSIVFVLNTLFYVSLLYFALRYRGGLARKALLILPVLALILALTVILFRYVETRYLLPIYPILTMTFGFMLCDMFTLWRRWRTKIALSRTDNV